MPFLLPANFNAGDLYTNVQANNVAAAINTIVNGMRTAYVATSEPYATAAWGDLATTTDQVTVTIGQSGIALVFLSASINPNTVGGTGWVSVAVSGANTIGPASPQLIFYQAPVANYSAQYGVAALMTGLAPGSTTFKLKYYINPGGAYFANRSLAVIPFP
jgi:hypothetical protein